jgi:alanyl-tRNA synthetase
MNIPRTIDTFRDFYFERGHRSITGSSLLPEPGDPVLFTTSGMHPLTSYLLGRPHPLGSRLVNVQRCLRTTDLEEVGDPWHLTVFEMLGHLVARRLRRTAEPSLGLRASATPE